MNAVASIDERTEWLAHRRGLDHSRPGGFFVECERSDAEKVVSVATIFLTNRECPWRCIYCDLWKNTLTETTPAGAIPAQIDFALDQFAAAAACNPRTLDGGVHRAPLQQIKLYNAGSFFDPRAIPPEDFLAIAQRVRGFERVIVECHPALVGESAVRFRDLLSRSAIDQSLLTSAATSLEVAMGLEIADDEILSKLNKRMTLAMFRRAAEFLISNGIAVRAFIIVKPPFVRSEEEAIVFARRSIDFVFDCGATIVSLIPARFGTTELETLAQTGEFAPPKLATLEAALDYGISLRRGRVFADLWDLEKFADCPSCFASRRERLVQINWQQVVSPKGPCTSCDDGEERQHSHALEQLAQNDVSAAGSAAIR